MAAPLAFSTAGIDRDLFRLADGRMAERAYNARKGKFGVFVYNEWYCVEAFYTDAQWARVAR